MTSNELVDQAKLGDRTAFTQLLQDNDRAMRALAFRMMGSQAAMDDVLQDAYLKAYKSLATFRGDSAFSTWLYSIVYRTSLDAIRRRERRREVGLQTVAERPSQTAATEDRIAAIEPLEAALAQLSPDHRAALLLVDGEGLSYDEAASILNTQPGTIASRLNRARSAVRSTLEQDER